MSTATNAVKTITFGSLLTTVFKTQVRTLFTARKTLILGIVMLLPIVGAALFVYFDEDGKGGLGVYKGLIEYVVVTFLLPLVCLFYGGPAVVDEIEGRTITYLFLRPVSKPAIFLGKYLAAVVATITLVVVPAVPVFFILITGAGEGAENAYQLFGQTLVSLTVGCLAYTAIFACLGAAFGRSLLAGILYWAVAEWGLSFVPVLEMGTQKYHIRNAGSLIDLGNFGFVDRMVLSEPVEVEIWVSYVVLGVVTAGAVALGSYLFNERQYPV